MGYTNIYEFGGIIDWTGDVVTEASDADTSQESAPESVDAPEALAKEWLAANGLA